MARCRRVSSVGSSAIPSRACLPVRPYLMEGGCDDMACDGEQVVTISGYEDMAANDEQALLKAGRTSPSAPPSRRSGGTSLPSLRLARPPQTAAMRDRRVCAHRVARSPVEGTGAKAHRSGRRRLRVSVNLGLGINPTICDLVKLTLSLRPHHLEHSGQQ